MTYWERRWLEKEALAQRDAQDVLKDIERLHARAQARIRAMAGRIRQRFRAAYGLTQEEADALLSSPVGREEYLKLLEEIGRMEAESPLRDALLAKAAAPSYAHRISVQEALESEVDAVTAQLAGAERALIERHLLGTAKAQSLRAGHLIQLEAGVGFRFSGVDDGLARVMLQRPWSGLSFSERIWRNRAALAQRLNEVLTEGLTAGSSVQAMAQEIGEAMDVSMSRARTLVRTETNYVCNAADLEAYKEAGVERYRFMATLDMRTSRACRALDGTVHALRDAVPGKNYPPMHPNCRSVTRAEIAEAELREMTRWSRDPVTGEAVKVPADMTYAQWLAMQEEQYGPARIEAAQKMAKNRTADERQLAAYRALLGRKRLPDTLAKFQQMKYTEPEAWAQLMRDAGTIQEIDGKPWPDAFKKKTKDVFWDMRGRGIEMSGHALARYMQRRNEVKGGCDTDALEAICKRPANYVQVDGRRVHLYDGAAVIFNERGIMISFIPRKNPKKEWSELT